ncbi:MAG TPA: glutamine amidotransferase, partial [Planctomycetota bacterium]|nr:glutamine amidotransferase [Planctomycetota bacterium]
MFGLHFASPWWLLGLALLPLLWWHARKSLAGLGAFRRWASLALRMLLVAAVAVALAEACWRQESREVTAIYLLDGSDSLPRADQERLLTYVRETSVLREGGGGRRADDLGGLVLFGGSASVERAPAENYRTPDQLASSIDREHTDITEGLRLAAASFPAGARKRIVLLSDGVETRGQAVEEARRLAGLGVRVECLPIARGRSPEVLVERLAVRPEARLGEPVEVRAVLRSSAAASGVMRLYVDGKPVETRRFAARSAGKLPAETFVVRLPRPDFYPIELRIEPDPGTDTLAQNNVGYAFTQVPGEAKVLVLYSPEGEGKKGDAMLDVAALAKALSAEKVAVKFAAPGAIPQSVAELAQYDCVIIANVGAYAFSPAGMKAVQSAVRDMGVGLIMIGGVDGFGAGGYLNTPIEEALPVTCDVRQRKVMPNGALALIMHTCEMPDPNFWGRKISDAAIDALSDLDDAGLIYYGNGGCAWLFPIQKVGPNRANMHALIKNAQPGDMPDFDTSLQMAIQGLQKTQAAMKHIIVISDGDPGFSNVGLLGQAAAAKITVSTVAIAPHDPNCTGALQNIATATGGRFYYPKNANLLPQIFVKEAMTVRRSVIFTEPFTPQWGPITPPVKGFQGVVLPQLGGYVVTTPKPRAELPLTVKLKDMEDPVLAHWQYGEGKAVAFTSTAAPDWAGSWIAWPGYGRFWAQLVRWTSRAAGSSDLQVSAEVRGGEGRVIVEAMDDQGRLLNMLNLAGHSVDPLGRPQDFGLAQTAPGRYEARFDAGAPGAYSLAVTYKDAQG